VDDQGDRQHENDRNDHVRRELAVKQQLLRGEDRLPEAARADYERPRIYQAFLAGESDFRNQQMAAVAP